MFKLIQRSLSNHIILSILRERLLNNRKLRDKSINSEAERENIPNLSEAEKELQDAEELVKILQEILEENHIFCP